MGARNRARRSADANLRDGRFGRGPCPAGEPEVVAVALGAMRCAQASGVGAGARRLALIDYSRPSTEPRLWVFDLASNRLLYQEVVAHGQGSGENLAKVFSNASGSHASSLGLFLTRDTYFGRNATRCGWQVSNPASTTRRCNAPSSCTARATWIPLRPRARAASPQLGMPRGARGRRARNDRRPEGRAVRVRVLPRFGVARPIGAAPVRGIAG
jgi:hypothetical protein